ncbi:ABC transporter ATP-binding protein [Methylobacterium radiodurans]|uniref:ABC transporter ATP-binding protein n=1 Tax=Methylobacterium radiodurans TaxID=2202828 RepID=UPI003CCC469A
MTEAAPVLAACGLVVGYRGRRVAGAIDLALVPGRALALLGPNGGGKTTLLRTLIGLLPPLAGEIRLEGAPLAAHAVAERARRIAYVPQAGGQAFGFSVRETVLMGRLAHQRALAGPGPADVAAAEAALARLGIAHLAERPVTQVSGGERQLALIARALAQAPRLIVLDEPTASLDFGNQGRVLAEMRALTGAGLAVLFTTHDPNQALRHADDVAMLADGRLVASGPSARTINRASLATLYGCAVEEVAGGGRQAFLPG